MSTDQPTVTYRLLPSDPGYRVGDDGSVWTCLARRGSFAYVPTEDWRELSHGISNGYACVRLRGKWCTVHSLVLTLFVGPCPDGMQCCHEDDNRLNNRLTNLRWDTQKANAADRYRNGRQPIGERSPRSKLTEESVRGIRTDHANGMSYSKIAAKYLIDKSQVANIVRRRQWVHIA